MKNEPTHGRLMGQIAGIGVLYQQRGTLALALANAVEAQNRKDAVMAEVRGETPTA